MDLDFKPLLYENTTIGDSIETSGVHIVFGNRFLTKNSLGQVFPHYDFCFLQQVHKADLVAASSSQIQVADGHYSIIQDQALVIQTADCVPILLQNQSVICALHAGWRGLAGQIIGRSLGKLAEDYDLSPDQWQAFIGPHIGERSFEVGREILPQLMAGIPEPHTAYVLPHANPQKAYVSLLAITKWQLSQNGVPDQNVFSHAVDTYQSPDCASYRRSGGSEVRQYSFIVRL